jgi:hypothetical protein
VSLPVHPEHSFPDEVSYSELSLLADCEEKWRRIYWPGPDQVEHEKSQKMLLGTILGACCDAFWAGESWEAEWCRLKEDETTVDEETWTTADWLMRRYEKHYADETKPTVVRNEVELKADLMGVTLVGHLDQLWETTSGRRWLVERKSTGKMNQTADFQMISPQVSLYHWLAVENGLDPYGVVTDLIHTYMWKRDAHKHPTSDTCRMLFQDRTEDQISGALVWANRLIQRRKYLLQMPGGIVRNLSWRCDQCVAKQECWDDLSLGGGTPVLVRSDA